MGRFRIFVKSDFEKMTFQILAESNSIFSSHFDQDFAFCKVVVHNFSSHLAKYLKILFAKFFCNHRPGWRPSDLIQNQYLNVVEEKIEFWNENVDVGVFEVGDFRFHGFLYEIFLQPSAFSDAKHSESAALASARSCSSLQASSSFFRFSPAKLSWNAS